MNSQPLTSPGLDAKEVAIPEPVRLNDLLRLGPISAQLFPLREHGLGPLRGHVGQDRQRKVTPGEPRGRVQRERQAHPPLAGAREEPRLLRPHAALRHERHGIFLGERVEAHDLAAREHCGGECPDLGEDQNQNGAIRWFFQRLQQRVRRRQGHPLGVIDEKDFHPTLVGGQGRQPLHLADLLDLNMLAVGDDEVAIRMNQALHLFARRAPAASLILAEERLGEGQGGKLPADPRRADKGIRMGHPPRPDSSGEEIHRGGVPSNRLKAHETASIRRSRSSTAAQTSASSDSTG